MAFCVDMAQVPPCQAAIISKTSLFWRTAFLIRDISEFSKDRLFLAIIQGLLGELSKAFYVWTYILQVSGGTKTSAKWSYLWKRDSTWPWGEGAWQFQDLDLVVHTIHIGRAGNTVGEEIHWGQDMPDQDPHFLFSFSGVCSMLGAGHFIRNPSGDGVGPPHPIYDEEQVLFKHHFIFILTLTLQPLYFVGW